MEKEVFKQLDAKIEMAISNIKKQYLANDGNIPWLIGYSGGKDSTCTTQLVYRSLVELKSEKKELLRKIYIFSSDTMIENPLVKLKVDSNISLINENATNLGLPIEALTLKPEIEKTFWVNVIGRGYPTPNTMFRWCTDRLKIDPANNFVHRCIDKNGEVIMVLGIREGESGTRDRTIKKHEIEGELLMKHTTLANAYVFPPIKDFTTQDIFAYLLTQVSPWKSNNKELYAFYEESGGGDCPMFLSQEEKSTSNSCGNSRMGCWACTVVAKDKSLTGFIQTGLYDYLKPLLEFRNWLSSVRDDDDYRCRYRNNGSVYTKKITKKVNENNETLLFIPKKGNKEKILITVHSDGKLIDSTGAEYINIPINDLSDYMKKEGLNFKSPELSKIIMYDHITDDYYKLGVGPFTDEAKKEIFERLIETEYMYNIFAKDKFSLITDDEIIEIKKLWSKSAIDNAYIDEVMEKYGRAKVELIKDSFEMVNAKYESKLKKKLKDKNLEFDIVNKLLLKEKDFLAKENRKELQHDISLIFNADKINF